MSRIAHFGLAAAALALTLTGCPGPADESKKAAAPAPKPAPAELSAAVKEEAKGKDGDALYQQSCAACHGPKAEGMPNLGKDMTRSAFVQDLSDAEMVAFVQEGRAADHPDNSTGIPMPPKGGNPALSDADILAIVGYVRSLQK